MTNKQNPKFQELVAKLREIFQIDRPELDFGIYRILNARADEINDYLQNRLAEKVQEALSTGKASTTDQLKVELEEAEKNAHELGVNPDDVPKVKELRARLKDATVGISEYENSVFSHLLAFFSRYYNQGDFISQRRYKGDTYAIPYAGEEVMLHWANKDQYYTKSGENFSNYSFKLEDGRLVHFRLVAADTAKDNRKDNDKDRRFALVPPKTVTRLDENGDEYVEEILPVEEASSSDGKKELIIRFEYATQPKGTKQEALVTTAVKSVLADTAVQTRWLTLSNRAPTEKNPQRTLLEKHLIDYTTKNTADYFIHKDLGGFLRRELDFYIKNEVMQLDDIQNAGAFADIERNLRMIQCLRSIAQELITFLAQLEDFQKKLWLKKRFVIEKSYCIPIAGLPEAMLQEVASNDQQFEQWQEYELIDRSFFEESLITENQKTDYLKSNKHLPIDTSLFSKSFEYIVLKHIDNLDENINGVVIASDNFQALNFIKTKYAESIKCAYIDPPFNLHENADFFYKVDYKDSAWLTLLSNRCELAKRLIRPDGSHLLRCNHDGNMLARSMLDVTFGQQNFRNEIIVRRAEESKGDLNKQFVGVKSITVNYDNIYWYSMNPSTRFQRFKKKTEGKQAKAHWHSFWKAEDRPNLRYEIEGIDLSKHYGQWMWKRERAFRALENYKKYETSEKSTGITLEDYWLSNSESYKTQTGNDLEFLGRFGNGYSSIKYWIPPRTEVMADNNWLDIKGYANKWGFKTENSEALLKRIYETLTDEADWTLDYFSGSGTSAAVAHKLGRKWLAVEMGEHVESVVKRRLMNVISGEKTGISKEVDWKGGGSFALIKLESYEDTINNLELKRSTLQSDLLDSLPNQAKDDYLLNYMLDVESRGSLLSVEDFKKPFDYTLNIAVDSAGAFEARKIDLVETFNYLIGLRVKHIDAQPQRGFIAVTGTLPSNETCLVLWRDCDLLDYEGVTKLCNKLAINPADNEYDVVYINGDHNIPTVLTQTAEEGGATRVLKLRQIEPEFLDRMFSVEDI